MDRLIAEFTSKGCTSPREAGLCAQVYLELTEVKKYWDVTYKYNDDLQKMCCQGRKTKTSEMCVFLPVHANEHLTFEKMQSYLALVNDEIKILYMVICTNDVTNVYYELTNGIGGPPKSIPIRQTVEARRDARDKQLNRNVKLLEEAAMCNIPITLSNTKKASGSGNKSKHKH